MRKIRTYSLKHYILKYSIWELNIISFTKACQIPSEDFKPFDIEQFNYEFEKKHGLLSIAEDLSNYSYS